MGASSIVIVCNFLRRGEVGHDTEPPSPTLPFMRENVLIQKPEGTFCAEKGKGAFLRARAPLGIAGTSIGAWVGGFPESMT